MASPEDLDICEMASFFLTGSITIATLFAGFTFNTLLGQSFQPRYYFSGEGVELLLALTFLFSILAMCCGSLLLMHVKMASTRKKELASSKPMWFVTASFACLVVNSASFVTLSLAIMAFQKAIGILLLALTSMVTTGLLAATFWTTLMALLLLAFSDEPVDLEANRGKTKKKGQPAPRGEDQGVKARGTRRASRLDSGTHGDGVMEHAK